MDFYFLFAASNLFVSKATTKTRVLLGGRMMVDCLFRYEEAISLKKCYLPFFAHFKQHIVIDIDDMGYQV